jgi:hypothetical protein
VEVSDLRLHLTVGIGLGSKSKICSRPSLHEFGGHRTLGSGRSDDGSRLSPTVVIIAWQ